MKKIFLSFLIFIVLICGSFFIFIYTQSKPVSSNTQNKVFVIGQNQGLVSISQKLENQKLIKNRFCFIFYSYFLGLNNSLKAGSFRLSPSLSTKEIAIKLSKGGSQDYWLKIIDGSRIEEIAILFPEGISFSQKQFLIKAQNKEGYFFPDSYLIPFNYSLDQTLSIIEKNFSAKFTQAKLNSVNTGLSEKETVILASLLEREGKNISDKQKIAGILLNRLKIGMPLQIDATVQYARDSKLPRPKEYWQPITKADISLDSPFNTYQNKGLPPSPICNPGFNSLFAAFHPTPSENLFYITGTNGQMYYAKTLEDHNENIQKYLK